MSSAKTSSLWRNTKTRTQRQGHRALPWCLTLAQATEKIAELRAQAMKPAGRTERWNCTERAHSEVGRAVAEGFKREITYMKKGNWGKTRETSWDQQPWMLSFFFFSSALTGIGSWCSPTNFSPNSSWIQLLGRSKCWAAPVLSWADQAGGGKLLGRAWETAECGKEAGQDKKNVQQNYGRCLDLHSPVRDGSNLQR